MIGNRRVEKAAGDDMAYVSLEEYPGGLEIETTNLHTDTWASMFLTDERVKRLRDRLDDYLKTGELRKCIDGDD